MTDNDNRGYSVYIHTFPTGEIYVGITRKRPEERWRRGEGYVGQFWVYSAIQKYGWDNIGHAIVETGLSESDARSVEHKLIDKYHSWCPGFGYNNTGGNRRRVPYHPVLDRTNNAVFATVEQACDITGVTRYKITTECNNRGQRRKRFYWYDGVDSERVTPMPLPR